MVTNHLQAEQHEQTGHLQQEDHLRRHEDQQLQLRVRRQVFQPVNSGTNTFVLDTTSFLSLLTLLVFIVRVFSRVIRSNTVQRVVVGADPSLAREFVNTRHMKSLKVKKHNLESAMKSDQFISRLKRNRRSNDRRSIDHGGDKSINSLFLGDIARPVISRDIIDELETVLTVLDKPVFASQAPEQKVTASWTQSARKMLKNFVLVFKQSSQPLDRRKRSEEFVFENGRQFVQPPLPPRVPQQGGIAGVDYDTIYLSIGVAATALFIIETLYKAYQLYITSNGRSLGWSIQSSLDTMGLESSLDNMGSDHMSLDSSLLVIEQNSEHG